MERTPAPLELLPLSRRQLLALGSLTIVGACTSVERIAPPSPSATAASPTPASIRVSVNGSQVAVPRHATVADAIEAAGLELRSGNLLDLHGDLLRRRAIRPWLEIDGERVTPDAPLADGVALVARHGKDRKEDVVTKEFPAGVPENPQLLLGGEAGTLTVRRGRTSHIEVSSRFEPGKGEWRPRALSLTFDDGPDPDGTTSILEILAKEDILATFFVIGYKIEDHPDVIKQIADAGHQIGTHSQNHPGNFAGLSGGTLAMEIQKPVELLDRLGVAPLWFRPPGGSWDEEVVAIAEDAGMRTVMWSIGTGDFRSGIPPHHVEHAVKRGMRKGAIVLMHDGGPATPYTTAKVLPEVIQDIRREHFDFALLEPDY